MDYLLNTNILLRGIDRHSPMSGVVRAAVKALQRAGRHMFVAPQNLIEFWCVASRPRDANGLGMTFTQAMTQITRIKRLFLLLPDRADIYPEWERLAVRHQVVGKKVHDARLVATMKVYGIQAMITFNVADYSRYTNIDVLDPQTLLGTLQQASV